MDSNLRPPTGLSLTCSDVWFEYHEEIHDTGQLPNPDLREVELMVDHKTHDNSAADFSQLEFKTCDKNVHLNLEYLSEYTGIGR